MTYIDLLNFLSTLNEEQLQCDVTVNVDGVSSAEIMSEDHLF
jgi:hypothetical protein